MDPRDDEAEAERSPERSEPSPKRHRYLLLLLGVGAVLYFTPRAPREQTVEIVLGRRASSVRQVDLRYTTAPASTDPSADTDWTREVTFRYGQEVSSPRVVHHEPRLPDGDYVVAIDLYVQSGELRSPADTTTTKVSVLRNVHLEASGTTSIDVAEAIDR